MPRVQLALIFREIRLQPGIVEELPCRTSLRWVPLEHSLDKLDEESLLFPLHVRDAVIECYFLWNET